MFVSTAEKVGVPKLGNCLEMYTCAQACVQACIQLQCTRGGQAVASVYKECPSLYTCCAQIGHRLGHMCTFPSSFQAWELQLLQQWSVLERQRAILEDRCHHT